jgi:hypothetical protein
VTNVGQGSRNVYPQYTALTDVYSEQLPQAPTKQTAVWKPKFRISAVILIALTEFSALVVYSPS